MIDLEHAYRRTAEVILSADALLIGAGAGMGAPRPGKKPTPRRAGRCPSRQTPTVPSGRDRRAYQPPGRRPPAHWLSLGLCLGRRVDWLAGEWRSPCPSARRRHARAASGHGATESTSQIALRMVAREAVTEPQWLELLATRLRAAIQRRKRLLDADTDSVRLCFSEADELPGPGDRQICGDGDSSASDQGSGFGSRARDLCSRAA